MVYGLLTIIMIYLSKISYRKNSYFHMILALLVYAIVFGLRYCVGVDYIGYIKLYDKVAAGVEVDKELAFVGLMKLFLALDLGVDVFFTFCAFFQLFFIFHLFKGHKEIYPYLVLTYMLGGEWLVYSNIIRNMFAFAIVAYSLKFVQRKSPLKHYFWLIVAFFFHKSSALMVVVYPLYLFRPEYFKKRFIQYGLLAGSIVLMNINYIQVFVAQMDGVMTLLGYAEKYAGDDRMDQKVSIGMGFFIELIITCIIIYYSPKVKDYYSKLPINIMYDLFIIGLVIKYSFIGSMLIQRENVYFIGYTFILSAIELSYLKKTKNRYGYFLLLGIYCLLCFAIMYRMMDNSAMFIFNFQDDMFYLKNDFR